MNWRPIKLRAPLHCCQKT